MSGEVLRKDPGHLAIKLCGNPYERGLCHGRLLRKEIADLAQGLPKLINQTTSSIISKKSDGKIVRCISRVVEWYLHTASKKFYACLPQWAKEEVEGLTAGSGQKKTTILLINTFDEILLADFFLRKLESAAPSCSAIAARGNQGTFVYGFNLDYLIFAEELAKYATVFLNQTETAEFISLGLPGSIGVMRGMNSKGLALGYLTSPVRPQKSKGVPTAILMRDILEKCSSPSEAVKYLRSNLPMQGINILLGNAQEAVLIECTPDALKTIKPGCDGFAETLTATNHFRSELAEFQHFPRIPACLPIPQELTKEEFSRKRLDLIKDLLGKNFGGDVNDIHEILSNPNVCHQYTILSCIFDPSALRAVFLDNGGKRPASHGRQHPYDLKEYFR